MDDFAALVEFLAASDVRAAIEDERRAHVVALRQSSFGARRAVVRNGLDLAAGGGRWQSLWLLTHRALRRGGVRRHPTSAAVLLAWRGQGLVLVRGPGRRHSVELAPFAGTDPDAVRWVHVAPGTSFDTLADETPWHLLVFHSEPAAGLQREDETQEGWIPNPEEADS